MIGRLRPLAPVSLGSRTGELSCARDRGRRAREALRPDRRGRRDHLLDRGRRGLRPARAERRGQDHDGRDPRGLPPRRRRRGARARRRPVARRHDPAAAHRRDAAGGRALSGRAPLEALQLFASYYDDPDDPERLLQLVGLDDSRHTLVRRMSGGQQQRLSLALALVGQAVAGVPRRTDRGDGSARACDDLDDDPRAARPRRDRRAHDPRHGRGRAPLRPRRHHRPRPARRVRLTQRAHHPCRRRRDHLLDRRRPRGRPPRDPARPRARRGARAAPGRLPRRHRGDARAARRAHRVAGRGRRPAAANSAPGAAASKTCSCASPARDAHEGEGDRRADPHRGAAHGAAGREPAGDAGDPARDPGVLLVGRRGQHHLQGSGRLPRAGRARPGGDVERDGEPRDRHRLRTPLRRAEAPRLDTVVTRRPAQRQDAERARARTGPGDRSSCSPASRSAGT